MILMIYLLFAVIHLTSSLNVDIPQPTYEFPWGATGFIPCNFKPQNTINPSVIISWTVHPYNPEDSNIDIITYYYSASEPAKEDVSDGYVGRASVQASISQGVATLKLQSLTSHDSRLYQCNVKIRGDTKGKSSDTTTLMVFEAPSKPICAIQGRAEFNRNIKLTCHSDEGVPVPTYKWQSYDVNNNPRPNPPKSTEANGVLSLFNISKDTEGYYVCTAANKIHSETCSLTLAVMPPSMNRRSTRRITEECAENCQWCTQT